MSDELIAQPIAEQPVMERPVVEEQPLSIMEHAAQFDPKRDKSNDPEPALPPLAANATPEEKAAHHSAQQKREENGEFKAGKRRHRAASQQATAADAPRIQELNRQIKELQGQLAAPRAATAIAPPPQTVHAPPRQAPAAPPASAQRWLGDPTNDPEPQEKDFGNDPMKYLSARFQWEARGVLRADRQEQAQQQESLQRSQAWAQRVEKAIGKYQDYEQVAFGPTTIPAGSVMDKFIEGDDNGAEVLYYLQSNPAERDAVLRLPVLQQLRHLSLLSQRFDTASPQAAAAGVTGSVPRSNIRHLVPRPPNPVRTEPHGATTGPPTDGSLSIADHKKHFAPQRR